MRRRTLLLGGAAGVLTACTPTGAPDRPDRPDLPPSRKDAAIFDLSLTEQHRYRPFDVVAPGFVQHERAGGAADTIVLSEASPPAPFAAVEVEVERLDGVLVAGLVAGADGADDRVVATCSAASRTVTLEVRVAGRTHVLRRATVDLPASFTFGVAVCENQLTALARVAGEWRPLLTERAKVSALVDLRDPDVLGGLVYASGVRSGTATLGAVRAGPFGMTGLRDPHVVQDADGTPYVRDGKAYLTWTCAGLGFFQQAHWGVFALDLADPTRLEQVAQLYSRRDGLLLGDHAGQLVRDGDRWHVATSSWGDFDAGREGGGVHVRHLTTTADLLSGVHLLETERTDLPTDVGSWDPGFTRIDGAWRLGFVESPSQDPFVFHPALTRTDADDPFTGLRRVGAADDLDQCEGPVLAEVGGDWWFLASDGDARHYPVFDLQMTRVGRLDAPYPTNIPHPQLLRRGTDDWLMVSFDGTQFAEDTMGYGGHGDVVIMGSRA